ncbi:MAG: Rrf2 family transcriptional regulator [bacterium]|nr:Rrf2 family transcriptional regulator [bacterium]
MISKTGVHAALALTMMAQLKPGEYAGTVTIAKEIGAPQNYLGKLLNTLAGVGLLESQKGFGGGFRLARKAAEISLYDIVEPIDKVSRWSGCLLGKGSCTPSSPCAVHDRWKRVREEYMHFLKETTLEDLARNRVMLPA